ncbi:isoprenoid synthase domain-containing protein [Zopfochytrium polystomum]|nr:isoprenoid synthase domain-containing protein [Zopfochytrium polystomum]
MSPTPGPITSAASISSPSPSAPQKRAASSMAGADDTSSNDNGSNKRAATTTTTTTTTGGGGLGTADPAYKERAHFEATFDRIADEVMADVATFRLPPDGVEWIRKMLYYTIPGGKMNRGLSVVSSLQSLKKRHLTEKELVQAEILGWCVELLQGFFLIADDIMDASITRRGAPCWYRADGVGMVAINDSFIVESIIYRLLRTHFRDANSPDVYLALVDLFHEVTFQTELGQLMDLITAAPPPPTPPASTSSAPAAAAAADFDFAKFSTARHAYIVEYKTAYYSFYLPVALAMVLAGVTAPSAFSAARAVLVPLGEYFQAQDDFLDCYGTPEQIGKVGTDIEDGKCSWVVTRALGRCSDAQRAALARAYGRHDKESVAVVKRVFEEVGVEEEYRRYEEESYERIGRLIEEIDERVLPREMFVTFMNRIYK